MPWNTLSNDNPVNIVVPSSADSGLSYDSLRLIALNWSMDASSLIVPLSDKTSLDSFWSLI